MIEKYLEAFPYSHTHIAKDSQLMFYLENKTTLKMLDLSKSKEREHAITICNEDFSKRSYGAIRFDHRKEILYLYSDDENKENFNIYSLDIRTKEFKALTNTTYCGIYGFSKDYSTLIFGDRYKTEKGRFFTKLYRLELSTQNLTELVDDADWEYRLSWSDVIFAEGNEQVYLSVDKDNQRKEKNIISLDLNSLKMSKIIPKQYESAMCFPLECKSTHNDLYFISECSGHENLYYINRAQNKVSKLTNFSDSINSIHINENYDTLFFAIDENKLNRTAIIKIEPTQERVDLKASYLSGSNSFLSSEQLWLSSSNMDQPGTLTQYEFEQDLIPLQSINNFYGPKDKLVHNSYEFIHYDSFDGKKVPAFISLPRGPVRGAIIKAFYGGSNYYSWVTQLFSELGFIVLSPAVRGSWEFGQEWRGLIKGDLGGNEIIDLQYGAYYLEKNFNLTPAQIGLEGGSHGGYSVLRGLTMPKNFKNDLDCNYPYGFGVCWAGFADLEVFYHKSNIPDWLVDFLGPYEENKAKYKDRSPLNHFDNLKAPLFIAHGTNDVRVPPSSMEGFLNKLKNSDKPHQIHIMAGLGHGAGNREEERALYSKLARFLTDLSL